MDDFATRLRLFRLEKGISQLKMAKKIGVAQNTYSRYESGKTAPDFKFVYKLRDLFGVNPDWLATGEGEMFVRRKGESVGLPIWDDELARKTLDEIRGTARPADAGAETDLAQENERLKAAIRALTSGQERLSLPAEALQALRTELEKSRVTIEGLIRVIEELLGC